MKTLKQIAVLMFWLIWPTLGYGQNEFPIGIMNFSSNFQYTAQVLAQIDSTNATWVQALGQNGIAADATVDFPTVTQNPQGLKVIAIRHWNILLPSRSQRMEIQAERRTDGGGVFNYFARTTDSTGAPTPENDAWQTLLGRDGVGYIARDMVPDDEYHFERNNYVATFVMRITATGVPTKDVVTLSAVDENTGNTLASRVLKEQDFPDANYRAHELSLTLPQPPAPPKKPFGQLLGTAAVSSNSKHVDVRVYWHGLVTTWLDVVWIEDTITTPDPNNFNRWGAYQIFPRFGQSVGAHDTEIKNDAAQYKSATTYPLVQRFYLQDEPFLNGYLSSFYVDNLLKQVPPDNLAQGRGRGITAFFDNNKAQRFLSESSAQELFFDPYPIHAGIPSPSIQDDAKALQNGIAIYTDSPNYNTALQGSLESLTSRLSAATTAVSAANRRLWFITQSHGELCGNNGKYEDLGGNKMLRPPTPNELRAMVNLAIAYGAKGIFFYPYGTDSLSTFSGCSPAWTVGLVSQERDANGYPFHNNNEATFTGISHAVYTGYKEKWDAVKSINTDLLTLGPVFVNLKWKSAFTSGNVPNEGAPSGSVVTSISGGDYIEAANFDSTGYDSYIMLVNRKCDLNDVQTVTVNTNKTGNWILDDQLTHELFVSSNGVFKEVKLNPGQGRLFRVRAMTTNETWSGTINVSNAITIANGSTLTIQPSATLKFSSAASLIINGKIVASSTNPSQRITFTGATQTPGFWNGITINASAAPNVLRRCDVQYAATGISINYTGNTDSVRVEKCKIRYHSDDGLFITGANYSSATVHPLIKDNSISNNVYGFELYDYAKPTITGNRIENNTSSGIFADSNCNAKVEYNYISGNGQYGSWFVISSNANVHRNTITSNSSRGIACASNSNLIANGSGNTKGRNKITNNSGVGIYASSSSPNFGISPNGYNWVQSNSSYEVQQTGSSNQVQIENCYWGGGAPGAGEISGNVDYSFYATTTPDPVGWGFSDTYDPTLRILRGQDSIIVALPFNDGQYVMLAKSGVTTTAGIINWTTDLQAAIDAGRKTGDWSAASALITALHIELQNARVPDVDFTLVNAYANDLTVAAFIRKMLALALMENDLAANNVSAALVKLTAFAQSNSANTAEFLINAGAIHLYRQNDVAAAQNVLARLQALAKNNDPAAIENAEAFGRILASYQRRNAAAANAAPKQMLASAQVLALPENAALAQNYPNPFNPETTIRFRLDEPQKVRLVIFDITGQRVRVLVNSELPAGEQAISWDGRDEYGKNAASGIYFYELAVGKKVEHKKMTLLR